MDELDFIFYFLFFYEFCAEEGAVHPVSCQVHFAESSYSYTFQHAICLHAGGCLAILFPDDASEVAVGSDPARPALNFVVGEPILVGSLEIGRFAIGLLGFDEEHFLEGGCGAGHGHFEDDGFAGELQGDGKAVGRRLVFVFGVASVHWNSIILN